MKMILASAFVTTLAGTALAAAPAPSLTGAPVRQNQNAQNSDLDDQTGQAQWDEDVKKTFQTVRRLKREMQLLTHENDGLKAMLDGNHGAAKAAYDALLALAPEQSEARLYRATTLSVLGDHQGALADYTVALDQLTAALGRETDPKLQKRLRQTISRVYGDRASTYMRLGLKGDAAAFDHALADCDSAINGGHPTPVMVTFQKSQILFAAKRFGEAAAAYERTLILDPKLKSLGDHTLFCRTFAEQKIATTVCN